MRPPGADPGRLRTAYANGDKFLDRVALYRYQRPRIRFPEWVLDHVVLRDGMRVADIGCGPGLYVQRLRARREEIDVVALDQSPGMVHAAGGGVVGDAQALPFAARSVDVVLAADFLYHVADIDTAIAEFRRVLRREGALVVATNGASHHHRVPELLMAASGLPALSKPGVRFDLTNGRGYLEPHFTEIGDDVVRGRVVLDDPEPIVRFIDSCEEFYAPLLDDPSAWPDVVESIRVTVTAEIAERGAFEMPTEAGVLVCRAG